MFAGSPLWVGETVDGTLEVSARRRRSAAFSMPLFDQEEWIEVEPPCPGSAASAYAASSGQARWSFPYDRGKATLDGVEYTRFRFQFRLTPNKPGTLIPPPARVMAEVQVGMAAICLAFRSHQSRLFQSAVKTSAYRIRPMPQAGRPPNFKTLSVVAASCIDVSGRTNGGARRRSHRKLKDRGARSGACQGADPAGCRGDGVIPGAHRA